MIQNHWWEPVRLGKSLSCRTPYHDRERNAVERQERTIAQLLSDNKRTIHNDARRTKLRNIDERFWIIHDIRSNENNSDR